MFITGGNFDDITSSERADARMDEPQTDCRRDGQAAGLASGGEYLAQLGEASTRVIPQWVDVRGNEKRNYICH